MTFLFHRAIGVGDNVVAIKAMFMLKKMYPKSKLIVVTNSIGENLYRFLPFIDVIESTQNLGKYFLQNPQNPQKSWDSQNLRDFQNLQDSQNLCDSTNSPNLIDYFILTHRTKENIALAKQTNAKKIIVKAHTHTLFSSRFINSFRNSNKYLESQNLLYLIRLVDKNRFDSVYKSIDFSEAKLLEREENRAFVESFFKKHKIWGGGRTKLLA